MTNSKIDPLGDLYTSWKTVMAEQPDMPLEDVRALFEHWGDVTTEPRELDYLEVDANGVKAMWAVPKGCAMDRVLVCTHGGGYVTGSMYSHRKLFGHFAKAVGCRALIVDYKRAPEYIHPGPVEDVVIVYNWLLNTEKIASNHIAFLGDSAGGGLAISTMLLARDKGLPLPAASIPLSPYLDMEVLGKSFDTNADRDKLVCKEVTYEMVTVFLGENGNRKDPYANPLYGNLTGLPPMLIQVGSDEVLLDDSQRFYDLAKAAHVDIRLEVIPGMQHVFHFLAGSEPEADKAIARAATWVRPLLGLA
ncbi:MAG: alpha/beta hydrolase [Porticoccaceae bacterium]